MKRILCGVLACACLMFCGVPAFADDAASSGAASAAVPSSDNIGGGAGRGDASSSAADSSLDGAESVVNKVGDTLDSAYDNMPEQDAGTLQFLSAFISGIPTEVIMACTLVLILALVLMLLRFFWK